MQLWKLLNSGMSHLCNRKMGWLPGPPVVACRSSLGTLPGLRKWPGPEVLYGAPLQMVEVWAPWLPLCCLVYSEEPRWPQHWRLKNQHCKCSQAKAYPTARTCQIVVEGKGQGQVQPQDNGLQVYPASQLSCMMSGSCNDADIDVGIFCMAEALSLPFSVLCVIRVPQLASWTQVWPYYITYTICNRHWLAVLG